MILWEHVILGSVFSGDCLIWQGRKVGGNRAWDTGGPYGFVERGGEKGYVHRVAYEAAHGPVPEGLVVDHLCHNRLCCNPAHLRATTTSGNMLNRSGAAAHSTTGHRGVYFSKSPAHKASPWRASVTVNGKRTNSYHATKEGAAVAAAALRDRLIPKE